MPKKPKFKPVISRIKLNPEQAVLTCSCYNVSFYVGPNGDNEWAGPVGCEGKMILGVCDARPTNVNS